MTPTLRRQISVARGFTGAGSTQAFIDRAVRAYLDHLRATMPNFRAAADALDAEIGSEPASDSTPPSGDPASTPTRSAT